MRSRSKAQQPRPKRKGQLPLQIQAMDERRGVADMSAKANVLKLFSPKD